MGHEYKASRRRRPTISRSAKLSPGRPSIPPTGPARATPANCTPWARTCSSVPTSCRPKLRVIVTSRSKYACQDCEEAAVQAPASPRLVEGGIPNEALVAHVLVAKYADHLPLYSQSQIYARQGIALDHSTLVDWVGKAACLLRPIHERLFERLKASSKLLTDETTAPVLDPGCGRTKTGQLFAYACDDRPWGGIDLPGVAYLYAPDREAEHLIRHLQGFVGVLQVDGYAGYRALAKNNAVSLAFCWSHVRRKFYAAPSRCSVDIASSLPQQRS